MIRFLLTELVHPMAGATADLITHWPLAGAGIAATAVLLLVSIPGESR